MRFARPINDPSPRVTQSFGTGHRGTDYGYAEGTPVYASQAGTVTIATDYYTSSWRNTGTLTNRDYGNLVKIDHGGGYSTLYAHLKRGSLRVSNGQKVKQGQLIAEVGNTGNSTGAHLHWEIRRNEVVNDPLPLLDTIFTAYGGQPPQSGGDGKMVEVEASKFEELVSKSTKYDEIAPLYEDLKKQFDENNATKDRTIEHLNQQIHDRNTDIARLNTEVSSLQGQLEALTQKAASFEEIAKRVPGLEEQLTHETEFKQRYMKENDELRKNVDERLAERDNEIKRLQDDALAALVSKIMRLVKGGGK